MGKLSVENLANTAWAFATAKLPDEQLFAALAELAERRASELNAQDVAGLVGEDDGLLVGQVEVVEDRVEGGPPVRLVVLCAAANPPDSAVLLGIMVTRGADVRRRGQC